MANLLEIPAFLRRENQQKKQRPLRKTTRQETVYKPGVPVKRPTKAQTVALTKLEWVYGQIIKLTRAEAATIIELKVGPEARFMKDKKHEFPSRVEEEEKRSKDAKKEAKKAKKAARANRFKKSLT